MTLIVDKITQLIAESKFGIHDLSRMIAAKKGEVYRMNMPFELGMDYGCKQFKDGKWADKKILILDKEQHRFKQALSDLSGCDIKPHKDDPQQAVIAVRDWLITEELNRGSSGAEVWRQFNDFRAYLYDEVVIKDKHSSIDAVQVTEVIHHIREWQKNINI